MKTPIEIIEPRCPFCNSFVEQPKELKERKPIEFPVGICDNCGAVYAYDATGHNQGAAFLEALLFVCNYDDYLAFSLSANEDYIDGIIENYDLISHKVIPGGNLEDRKVRGVLIFVRLNPGIEKFTEEMRKEKIKSSFVNHTVKKSRSERFSRERVQTYVSENRLEDLFALAEEDTRVIPELIRMLYTPDELLRWKIIEIISEVSSKIGEKRPEIVSKFLNRLLLSAADSASSAWGALETVGATISRKPDLFGEFSHALLSFLQYKNYRKQVTWAIGRIAAERPDLVKYAFRLLCSFLSDTDPEIRGHAIWALGNLGFKDPLEDMKKLLSDESQILLFREGELKEFTIAELAREAIEKLS
ncbi:MAG: DVU0298 family protein [Thermodesulfovibrionales bacterium]